MKYVLSFLLLIQTTLAFSKSHNEFISNDLSLELQIHKTLLIEIEEHLVTAINRFYHSKKSDSWMMRSANKKYYKTALKGYANAFKNQMDSINEPETLRYIFAVSIHNAINNAKWSDQIMSDPNLKAEFETDLASYLELKQRNWAWFLGWGAGFLTTWEASAFLIIKGASSVVLAGVAVPSTIIVVAGGALVAVGAYGLYKLVHKNTEEYNGIIKSLSLSLNESKVLEIILE